MLKKICFFAIIPLTCYLNANDFKMSLQSTTAIVQDEDEPDVDTDQNNDDDDDFNVQYPDDYSPMHTDDSNEEFYFP
jgi:hypothetical protein